MSAIAAQKDLFVVESEPTRNNIEFDDFTTSSIIEFLNKEGQCLNAVGVDDDGMTSSEIDVESLFDEINRLSDNADDRSVEEILREAEALLNKNILSDSAKDKSETDGGFKRILLAVHPDSVISEESIPKDMKNSKGSEDGSVRSDLIDEITENLESARLINDNQKPDNNDIGKNNNNRQDYIYISSPNNYKYIDAEGCDVSEAIPNIKRILESPPSSDLLHKSSRKFNQTEPFTETLIEQEEFLIIEERNSSPENDDSRKMIVERNMKKRPEFRNSNIMKVKQFQQQQQQDDLCPTVMGENILRNKRNSMQFEEEIEKSQPLSSQKRYESSTIKNRHRRGSCEIVHHVTDLNETFTRPNSVQSINSINETNSSTSTITTIGIKKTSTTTTATAAAPTAEKVYCNKSTNSSPIHTSDAKTSPIIENVSIAREHILKHEIEKLQEKLKDTEERLQSLRIQHDSLAQVHRDLRESHTHIQEESELLKLDVQHLTECANILRSELQSARNDRNEALEVQKILQTELDESRNEKKKAQEHREKDAKTIMDLQRQCREMERILMRKHPDSVSALIVAAKNPNKSQENASASRRLLEQRIAQLESDAKEQDLKAQKILANVQARFNSVQAKYETHIADLETQVLSLQEINAKLNEKIESQFQALNKFSKNNKNLVNDFTQTDDIAEREMIPTSTATTQTDSTSRPNSSLRQTPPIKKSTSGSKMPASHSDSTISAYHASAREDAHLLATIRGMRVDLAIKDKAMQRLSRELEECKKTIKKLQKERDAAKSEKLSSASSSSSSRKSYDPNHYVDQSTAADSQALKEALNKIKLLEFDYKSLHDKRLQDLKTLQAAHERELASCHETVRILQQRLAERDEAFNNQKRRKVPIDYYALKAKVTSLERRHSEREQRLHMLVEALSKGRLNGNLEEILTDK